jgi:hypothetical protein
MRIVVMILVSCCALAAQQAASVADGLKVIVIDGDEAANIVAERIAAEPVIEVRDKDDRRVAGAVVRFAVRKTVRDRIPALFRNGQPEVRTITDAAGRARATAVTPLETGPLEIEVQVSHQGRTATATIRQTNFATRAEAQSAGRQPGQSSGANAAGQAAAAAGGGLSKLAIVGLAVGGAAGAGAAVVLSQKNSESSNAPAARVTSVSASQSVGVQAATPFSFSVQVADFDPGSVTYRWDFGDGGTSADPAPTHVYASAGTFTVVVTVTDARQSARSELSVIVHTISGTWVSTGGTITLQLTQSGTTISGVSSWRNGPAELPYSQCPISGSVQGGPPAAIVLNQARCPHPVFADLIPIEYRLGVGVDVDGQVGLIGEFRAVAPSRPDLEQPNPVGFRRSSS